MPQPLTCEEAQQRILAHLNPLAAQQVTLTEARHRVVARDVLVVHDAPPFTNSAMDGYAVRATECCDGARLQVRGTVHAGATPPGPLGAGCAMRIFTGAPLPPGADSVVMQEHAVRHENCVSFTEPVTLGQWVRLRGDDMRRGDLLLRQGDVLRAGEIGALASQGIAKVWVHRAPKVAIVPTGDELLPTGAAWQPGKIYDANSALLAAMVSDVGGIPVVWPALPDKPDALREGFLQAAEQADIVITTGGVSVGDFDYVRDCLQSIGSMDFWRVAVKPGKPLTFGHVQNKPLIGLPGNPVSCFVCFALFARPALRALLGHRRTHLPQRPAQLAQALEVDSARREFKRARLHCDAAGAMWVTPLAHQGSHQVGSLVGADCLLDIAAMSCKLERGHIMPVLLLHTDTA